MHEFKFLKITPFEPLENLYNLATSLNESSPLDLNLLVEAIFLQIYSKLEEALYLECEPHLIKKNASIIRFETALAEQGYDIHNEHWHALIGLSKIRNCLLHGNGKLDADRYGLDTKETINFLNSDAHITIVEIIHANGHSKIKLNEAILNYSLTKIKQFIDRQIAELHPKDGS